MIIGEVAQAHDGSLGTAHAFVDAIAEAGADAVKFQTHIAAEESTDEETFRVNFSYEDKTRPDYWKRMEFTKEQWQGLAEHARERGLIFLSSPFSVAAVELLERAGMPAWKIASGEANNYPMLERMTETGKPILLSSGMSPWSEIDATVQHIKKLDAPLALFQCTTAYPCPPERIGLNVMTELAEHYQIPVGLSDHSGTIFPSLAAATMGASLIEVHVTLSREMFGPDVPASVTTAELKQLVEGVRFIEAMLANPVDKDALAEEFDPLRQMFFKSVVARDNLKQGNTLKIEQLDTKKPGTGIPATQLEKLIGRVLARDVAANQMLHEDDLEPLA
ncbi:MAG: N-acetylneuraminate synthase [Chloroflexi bacterium]|nr:MAG: N-acetylneuraminate synthase [Chloroflexota bacterium]MBL1193091.1 N-acetylneuraminate synthase [Chloroflexota bacterium]NOH10384.1 N-acetylneuraminate synthase [Chloroflexota bacterium]